MLHEAVNACSNAQAHTNREHGDLNAVSSLFNGSICADEKLFIYLDKSYHPCDKDDAAYKGYCKQVWAGCLTEYKGLT